MKVLGLEASTAAGSVALVDERELQGELWFNSPRTHSERILHGVDQILRGAGLHPQDIQGVAVGLGPGSFTGIRIALSTAKGLALALSIPLVGVPTLEAMAHNVPFWPQDICPMVDARRGHVYGAVFQAAYRSMEQKEGQRVRELTSWLRVFSDATIFLGTGAVAYRETIRKILGSRAHFPPAELLHPRAAVIARLGLERMNSGVADDLDHLEPLYLKRSEPEPSYRTKGHTNGETVTGQRPDHSD